MGRPAYPMGARTVYDRRGGSVRYHQAPIVVNGRNFVSRTYQRGGVQVVRHFAPYSWGRTHIYVYHPRNLGWSPAFWGWSFTPWPRPVSYRWGWCDWNGWGNCSPWAAHYGYYYRPYSTYYGPSYWLTDWLIADMLARDYENRLANARAELDAERARANQAAAQNAVLTEEIKEQIKLQIEASMRAQQAQEGQSIAPLMSDLRHVYAVSEEINATNQSTDEACSLTSGDLIRLAQAVSAGEEVASVQVVSSKHGDCAVGTVVSMAVSDLQEFQNDFNERVESGMEKMKTEFKQP